MTAAERRSAQHLAREAVGWFWASIGNPGVAVSEAHHLWLRETLVAYVKVRFEGWLDDRSVHKVVEAAIYVFLPPLYLRPRLEGGPSPEDVFDTLDNLAIDHSKSETGSPRDSGTCSADDELVGRVFGQGTSAEYGRALNELVAAGERDEFLVVTEFVSLYELANGKIPGWQEVADRLADPVITASRVQQLVFKFIGRLRCVSHA